MPATYYDILGIPPKHTREELLQAYLRKACEWHPENNARSPESIEHSRKVGEAFAVLYDSKSHFRYAAFVKSGQPAAEFSIPFDSSKAASLFREMLTWYILFLLSEHWEQGGIKRNVLALRCPEGVAAAVYDNAVALHRTDVRRACRRRLICWPCWVRNTRSCRSISGSAEACRRRGVTCAAPGTTAPAPPCG